MGAAGVAKLQVVGAQVQAERDVDPGAAGVGGGRTAVPAADPHLASDLASSGHWRQRRHMQLDPPAAGFGKLGPVGGAAASVSLRHDRGGPAVATPARRLFVPGPVRRSAAEERVDGQPLVRFDRGCEEAGEAALESDAARLRLVRRHGETGIQIVDDDCVRAGVEERWHPAGRPGAAQRFAVRDRLVVNPWQLDGELAPVQGEVGRREHRSRRPGGDEPELHGRAAGNQDRFA